MNTNDHRGIGLAQGTALYIAAVLGTGILLLPALAARAAGPGSIIAVAALAVISVPLAATFAALSKRHPDAGGVATFARRAFGPTAARVVSYWFYFGTPIGAPIAAIMTAQYVVAIVGGGRGTVIVIAAALIVVPIAVTMFGVRFAGWVQLVLSAALMAILVLALAAAAPHVQPQNFTPLLPHGAAGVGVAISLYVWAFAGWEAVAGIAGEFSRPHRDIPRATALALLIVAVAYVAIQTVVVGVLGTHADGSQAPLLDLVTIGLGQGWGMVVACVAVIVVVGVFNAYFAAFSKLGAAMGRDGDLPAWFGHGVERGGIARRGLLLSAGVMAVYFAIVVWIPDLQPVILVHTSMAASIYAMGVASALVLLPRWSLGWWMSALSCLLVLGLLLLAGANLVYPAIAAAVAIIVGAVAKAKTRASVRTPVG
ncbi:APC family permease [Humibacter ginsenosidimutans]|uniref:Amino acid permease n=1 Tax=Humibacter ginsenosidimutans TaxID=2599293 RepID=A0A5B8M715_9MICO|nr:amino acid permease [Humibacter ginsenosidimutans]QDZ16327.1 amino acid permease [Humibacter ginsenosidimutans]